ncbi:sulfite exporter TauE/SafE family protein [Xenophilus sp. Marseille-Q4582]|uniref:sulfite exporter TauE/SafE family protein n=1 Tax=Xenophilus sp. Marseille-Q4582 TaxID=2866600 RepID=UPI001CE4AB45|nr:sulfite exporter TauE/SafE family protein [Xenophilus sp. Marseille-Q4582]
MSPLETLPGAASAAAVFLLAGMVKGVIGLGLPTFSMALLALWMPPAQAAALLVVPSLVTNAWQAGPLGSLGALLRRLGGLQLGVFAGTVGGVLAWGPPAGRLGAGLLGLALIAYAAWGLAGRRLAVPARGPGWAGAAVGLVTGLLTALTGVFVIPAVPWLQSLGLEKDELVQAMGLCFTTSTVALALGLAAVGSYAPAGLMASLGMLPAAGLGMVAGQWLRRRLPLALFRRCFFIALALLGAWMVSRAAMA